MLRFCDAHPGQERRQTWRLTSGLTIVLYVDADGARHVLLSRENQAGPSDQEAKTVLEHWPEAVDAAVRWARPARKGKVICMTAVWPKPARQLTLGDMEQEGIVDA